MKHILHSKTLWFNMVALLLEGIQYLANQSWISPELAVSIIGIGNIILRYVSTGKKIRKISFTK